MKRIQWFPGHMTKAMRMMENSVPLADGVIYVLDARCPAASFNPKLLKLSGNKPVIYVLNKGDLADERADNLLRLIGGNSVKINAVNSSSRRDIMVAIQKSVAEKREKNLAKGYNKTFRFMDVSYPHLTLPTILRV